MTIVPEYFNVYRVRVYLFFFFVINALYLYREKRANEIVSWILCFVSSSFFSLFLLFLFISFFLFFSRIFPFVYLPYCREFCFKGWPSSALARFDLGGYNGCSSVIYTIFVDSFYTYLIPIYLPNSHLYISYNYHDEKQKTCVHFTNPWKYKFINGAILYDIYFEY